METIQNDETSGLSESNGVRGESKLQVAKQFAQRTGDQILRFIKRHPTESFLGALALGFVVGRLVTRK